MGVLQGFVAYSSDPPSIGETIEEAIKVINKSNDVKLVSWKSLENSGRYVIDSICKTISESNIFICELTNLNFNVLFELGYAISERKQIIILLDTGYKNVIPQFNSFGLLTTIGYTPYTNSQNIINCVLGKQYDDSNKDLLIDTLYNNYYQINEKDYTKVLYLKSPIETEASIKLTRVISNHKLGTIIDDPSEVSVRPLPWYIQNIFYSGGIIAHLLASNQQNNIIHNAKSSLICGMGYGLKIPIIMLAHEPFESPIDYKNILCTHDTANKCEKLIEEWITLNKEKLNQQIVQHEFTKEQIRAQSELQRIDIGDSVAENESSSLSDYFIQTASFDDAMRSNHSIFIGRKGCGKTANFFELAKTLDTPENHVCVIKPVAYEIEFLLAILKKMISKAERGFLVESLWKFLIYTELAKSIVNKLRNKPSYYEYTKDEQAILDYVSSNTSIIEPEFSERLDYAVSRLDSVDPAPALIDQKKKISELLHNNIINDLRAILGNYLRSKKKVAILVDNLDKAWSPLIDTELIGEFIFGLLDVGESIIKDFSKEDYWRQPANLSLIIFLRDDIYNHISQYAPEKDKLPIKKILWEDKDILLRVIEERMSNNENVDIWERFFSKQVKNESTKDYIFNHIIPRPRDIIVLVKSALNNAVSKKHTIIQEEDILDAQKSYSQYAFSTLISENNDHIPHFEDFLFQFAGMNELISEVDVLTAMENSKIDSSLLEEVIDCLCSLSFLGLEISTGRFQFIYNEDDLNLYRVMAKRTSQKKDDKKRQFKIHKAFQAYLEIEENSDN